MYTATLLYTVFGALTVRPPTARTDVDRGPQLTTVGYKRTVETGINVLGPLTLTIWLTATPTATTGTSPCGGSNELVSDDCALISDYTVVYGVWNSDSQAAGRSTWNRESTTVNNYMIKQLT